MTEGENKRLKFSPPVSLALDSPLTEGAENADIHLRNSTQQTPPPAALWPPGVISFHPLLTFSTARSSLSSSSARGTRRRTLLRRLIAIVSPDSAPVKRLVQESRDRGMLIDATYGRKTASVLIMDSDHVVLSALSTEKLAPRLGMTPEEIREEEE